MPQLDVLIFFSQYFIFLLLFSFFYVFIVKYIVKETDFIEQMGKHKLVSLYSNAAIIRMIFDKLNKKTKNFKINIVQLKNNLNKNYLFELIVSNISYKKYALFFVKSFEKQLNNTILKFKNYINK